jgi:prolyl 4-hydroxylase
MQQGRRQEAVMLVQGAADGGDPEANYALANWRVYGLYGPRDLAAAHERLDRAVASGHSKAALTKAALLANGTGGERDESAAMQLLENFRDISPAAASQLVLLNKMPPLSEVGKLSREVLFEQPLISVVRDLLSAEECAYLTRMAEPHLQPSFVIDPRTGARVPHPVRRSMGMSFSPTLEDLVIRRINIRVAHVSGTNVDAGEPLHMLRYAVGDEYKPHLDALPGSENPRMWTVLLYLNSDFSGGATGFDRLGLEFTGRPGDALIFLNVDEEGNPDPMAEHSGRPVSSGHKWLATRWIRRGPYDVWDG